MQPELMELQHLVTDEFHTGSSYICNPPVTDTDIDIVVLTNNREELLNGILRFGGYLQTDGRYSPSENNDFVSARVGNYNYIVVKDIDTFTRWKKATSLAKALNLRNKEDRITLFKAIVQGDFPSYQTQITLDDLSTRHEQFGVSFDEQMSTLYNGPPSHQTTVRRTASEVLETWRQARARYDDLRFTTGTFTTGTFSGTF